MKHRRRIDEKGHGGFKDKRLAMAFNFVLSTSLTCALSLFSVCVRVCVDKYSGHSLQGLGMERGRQGVSIHDISHLGNFVFNMHEFDWPQIHFIFSP